jgi:phage FluMu protein gp41
MPMAQEENAMAVTANSVIQESTLGYELELNTTNVGADVQKYVDLLNNSNVVSGSIESPVSVHQLQSMLTTFTKAMQARNAKLASIMESKLNKLADDLATVFDRFDAKTNLMIANVTSEMRR